MDRGIQPRLGFYHKDHSLQHGISYGRNNDIYFYL